MLPSPLQAARGWGPGCTGSSPPPSPRRPSGPGSSPGWRGARTALPCCPPSRGPQEVLWPQSVCQGASHPPTQCRRTGRDTPGKPGPALAEGGCFSTWGPMGVCGEGPDPLSTRSCTHVRPQHAHPQTCRQKPTHADVHTCTQAHTCKLTCPHISNTPRAVHGLRALGLWPSFLNEVSVMLQGQEPGAGSALGEVGMRVPGSALGTPLR